MTSNSRTENGNISKKELLSISMYLKWLTPLKINISVCIRQMSIQRTKVWEYDNDIKYFVYTSLI